ncbi:MAG: type I pantothenate kinase [Gemmatimonadota bacterium]|jgi:type I pantothenate kinase|nr:type I pantothenate kinase [Gemmatimonadota bacterium]
MRTTTLSVPDVPPISPYVSFTRTEWARLGEEPPTPLTEADLIELRGVNDEVSLREVSDIYVPVAHLLSLHVEAAQGLYSVTERFLGNLPAQVPFVIGVAGSVAAGKSTVARILQAILSRWPNHPRVDLVTTDGFLFPNEELERRGLMRRKGFPESYDIRRLVKFVADLKSGVSSLSVPVYSHLQYDIIPGEEQRILSPDIVIIEGLNVLQPRVGTPVSLSDFFDFSIYVDARLEYLRNWYVERFFKLRDTVFQHPESYFHRYAHLTEKESRELAITTWTEINERNLIENIEPTRERASLVLEKGKAHGIETVRLRRM